MNGGPWIVTWGRAKGADLAGRAVHLRGAVARGRLAVVAVAVAAHAHDLGVDGRADAVVHLAVDLGQGIRCARTALILTI